MITPQKLQTTKIGATPQTQIRHQPQQIATRLHQYTSPRLNTLQMKDPRYIVQQQQQQLGTPFPIINQNQKSLFEKVVDYLINDGPSSRYGMICKECYGHNGKCFTLSTKSMNNLNE